MKKGRVERSFTRRKRRRLSIFVDAPSIICAADPIQVSGAGLGHKCGPISPVLKTMRPEDL